MSLNNLVKRLQDIMRNDAGINGDAQRIEQMVWILFLKVYDAKEEIWEFYDENYTSIIPEELRWRNWAVDHKQGRQGAHRRCPSGLRERKTVPDPQSHRNR